MTEMGRGGRVAGVGVGEEGAETLEVAQVFEFAGTGEWTWD